MIATRKQLSKAGISVLLVGGLSGCLMNPSATTPSGPLTATEKQSIETAVPQIGPDKSVLVVRVLRDGGNCHASGTVRVTPLIDGRLVPDRSINAGHTNMGLTGEGFASFGKSFGHMMMFDFSGAERENSLQHVRTSYVAVPPGDYVVTHVQCAFGPDNRTSIGGGNRTGWLPPGAGASTPVDGDNFIRVPAGRIVDAGYLDIKTTEAGGFLSSAKGTLVGRPVGSDARARLQAEFPGIYSKTVFSRFSAR